MKVDDGKGKGNQAGVSDHNRLQTEALVISGLMHASLDTGIGFWAVSGFVALTTTGSFSGILYLKNDSTVPVQIWQLRTCGNVVTQWKIIKNPTTGTLISAGTAKVPGNLDTGSSKTFDGTVKAGADAQTVTDGTDWAQWINDVGHSTHLIDGAIVIGPGDSVALTCKPAGAGDVCATLMVTQGDVV